MGMGKGAIASWRSFDDSASVWFYGKHNRVYHGVYITSRGLGAALETTTMNGGTVYTVPRDYYKNPMNRAIFYDNHPELSHNY
jgi:hypothetical protein